MTNEKIDRDLWNGAVLASSCFSTSTSLSEEAIRDAYQQIRSYPPKNTADWKELGCIFPELVYRLNGDIEKISLAIMEAAAKEGSALDSAWKDPGQINILKYQVKKYRDTWNAYRRGL